jgi:hypothetical protein
VDIELGPAIENCGKREGTSPQEIRNQILQLQEKEIAKHHDANVM